MRIELEDGSKKEIAAIVPLPVAPRPNVSHFLDSPCIQLVFQIILQTSILSNFLKTVLHEIKIEMKW